MFRILLALLHLAQCIMFTLDHRLSRFIRGPLIIQVCSYLPVEHSLLALLTLSYCGLALVKLLMEWVCLVKSVALLE